LLAFREVRERKRRPRAEIRVGSLKIEQKGRLSSGSGLAKPRLVCHTHGPLANTSESVQCRPLEVQVGDKGIERAIKHLKRKMAAEGILRELKRRRHYMKPSIKKRKKQSEAARRRRKRLKTDEIPRTMG
jgi:small subunit ribosomal protein S21